jgi:RLL motif-containing protein 1
MSSFTAAAAAGNIPPILVRKLTALGYPEVASLSLSDQTYCKAVLWLEEAKIRFYEKADRKGLRDFSDQEAWYTQVGNYCKELGVNADGLDAESATAKLRVINGLANLAINDAYRDKLESKELLQAPAPKVCEVLASSSQKLQELIGPLNSLLESVSLPKLPADSADADTLAALECVYTRVAPPSSKDVSPLDLDQLPVGFEIADTEVKRAACVLRLLHGSELRDLQVRINVVINELQKLTADPKTDARLGRVGH